jgi:hypothetical protein
LPADDGERDRFYSHSALLLQAGGNGFHSGLSGLCGTVGLTLPYFMRRIQKCLFDLALPDLDVPQSLPKHVVVATTLWPNPSAPDKFQTGYPAKA